MHEFGLQIIDNKCLACGNKWVDSQLLYKTDTGFGTVANNREFISPILKNPALVSSIHTSDSEHPACFRCVRLGLNQGWTSPDAKLDLDESLRNL